MFRKAMRLMLAALPLGATGYEIDTHAFVTSHAFDRSIVATPELAVRLGLDRFDALEPFRVPQYVEYSGERAA